MKIYLADKFGHKMKMRDVHNRLEAVGHEVTAQWVYVEESTDGHATENNLISYAKMNVDDVLRADVLVAFSYSRGLAHTGGGRHVEFGVAIQAGKPIIVVGPKGEHIFHYMPGVRHVPDVDALIQHLNETKEFDKGERATNVESTKYIERAINHESTNKDERATSNESALNLERAK